jgi:hypothetical protein
MGQPRPRNCFEPQGESSETRKSIIGDTCATYLSSGRGQRFPIYARQQVDEEILVELDLVLHELGVFGVQGVRVRRRLARLDGARQKV